MNYAKDSTRRQTRADWDVWAGMTKTLFWRPNVLLFAQGEGTPVIYVHKLGEDLRYFVHHSLAGTDFDSCTHHWATQGVNFYVLARLLWNPEADVDAILDDYCQSGFGDAWRHVRRYLAHRRPHHRDWRQGIGCYCGLYAAGCCGIARHSRRRGCATSNATVHKRLQFLRHGLEFTSLQNRTHALLVRSSTAAGKKALTSLQQKKWLLMRRLFREDPLAVNVAMVGCYGERLFQKFGWLGAKSVPPNAVDADEEGRPLTGEAR